MSQIKNVETTPGFDKFRVTCFPDLPKKGLRALEVTQSVGKIN